MSDPRYDPRLSDPVMRRPDSVGGMWSWIAGVAVLVLIAIILIAGWNSNTRTATNGPAATTGSATAPVRPLAAPPAAHPMTPAPAPSR